MKTLSRTMKPAAPINTASILKNGLYDTKKILDATFGLWRGRKLDPRAYQRKMRNSYTKFHRVID